MTGTRHGTIAVGTRICHDGRLWHVVEMTGDAVMLRDAFGGVRQAGISHLLTDPGTRLADVPSDQPVLAGPGISELTGPETDELRSLTGHVLEVVTGYQRGSAVLALHGEPRPDYAPGIAKLERCRAKAAELGVSVMTVRRMIWRFEADGPEGLVDQRKHRGKDPLAGVDARWQDMARRVLAEHTEASKPTRDLILAEIAARLAMAASTSPLPGNHRSNGSPASPGPARTPPASPPPTCTRSFTPVFRSAPSPPGSAPPPTTSGWPLPATRHPRLLPAAPPSHQRNPNRPAPASSALTEQGFGPRKIARLTGCSERAIRQMLTAAGLWRAPGRPAGDIDPHWLRQQYDVRRRSLKDIAAETGTPVAALAAAARNAGIPVRHGINGHAHPLACLGGPGMFPPAVWNAFSNPRAEQRIRRILAAPGHPSLHHAARHLAIKPADLRTQIRQTETATGTTLLHISPGQDISLTPDGEQFARDVRPVLEKLALSGTNQNGNYTP